MIAAKAMDPVVGIDIHIIQPPGPVPPVPIPHPFVGMTFDPMDFAPIIGATVMVNGMPRATAGTGAKAIPPHIPIGGVFVKGPPASEGDVFMGSSTVLADGDPLSRLGMPVLTCHDIGMPPIPRLKKKRKPTSLALPTSVLLAVPMGRPVLVGGAPTISMMALGMKAGMAALGAGLKKLRKLQKGSRRMKAVSDKIHAAAKKAMDKLGIPPSVQNRVHRAICTVTGHPVDVATGKVFTEAVDLELDGALAFRWERVWYSTSVYDGPLGRGWHHSYDAALLAEGPAVAVRLPDGRGVGFPALAPGEEAADAAEGLVLTRDAAGYALRDRAGLTYRFAPAGRGAEHSLVRLENGRGGRLEFAYSAAGHLVRVADAAGRVVTVVPDARGRVAEIRAPRAEGGHDGGRDGGSYVAVRYEYDDAGDLAAAYDALGQPFRYFYDAHLLVREADRRGYTFHFRYDGRDHTARCVATWGEDGLFSVRLSYAPDHTLATFDDGGTWTYRHDGTGLVRALVDPYGGVTEYAHDAAGRVAEEVDPNGDATTFEYDDAGVPVRRVSAAGHASSVGDDPDDDVPDPDDYALPETPLEWEYGTVASVIPRRIDDGWIAAQLPPAAHEALLAVRAANAAATPTEHRDLLGRVTEQRYPDGTRESWAYDPEGNVLAYGDRDGAVTRQTYASRNLLVAEVDALGHTRRFEYSRSGEVTRFVDAGGTEHAFGLDLAGRDTDVRTNGQATDAYLYDAAGNLVERRDGTGRTLVRYDISLGGVDAARVLADGEVHTFSYDDVGRRVLAETPSSVTAFAYHGDGSLAADLRDGAGVEHALGEAGALRTTCLGRFATRYDRDPDRPDERVVTDPTGASHAFAVGRSGEVLKRLASGTSELACYGRDGRCGAKVAWRADGGRPPRVQQYAYSPGGDLRAVRDSERGATAYAYDAAHRLQRETRADGRTVDYAFDAAGNLLRQPGLAGVLVGTANRLVQANGAAFTYDAHGNVAARAAAASETRYVYDALDRLTRVEVGGATWEAQYDPLGRRVSKTWRGQTTRYWWDDFRLAAEERPDGSLRVYVYPDRVSLVPFLFVEYASAQADPADGRPYYVFANHLGAPTHVEDAAGRTVWAAELDPFGVARVLVDGIDMPLRFPGHYYDAETGLHYNRFRYYSPELGRFLQPDPLGFEGTSNLYAYSCNPLVEVDLDGLTACGGRSRKPKGKGKKKGGPKKKGAPKPPGPSKRGARGYATQDGAARAALNKANPKSIKDNLEYGGLIYKDPKGRYHYTGPGKGTDQGFDPSTTPAPAGTTVTGDYHTHGDYSTQDPTTGGAVRTSNPAQDDFNSDNFSGSDITGITADGAGTPGYAGYLGTPSGDYRKYDPGTGTDSIF